MKSSGSVSVYFIIVTAAFVLLTGLLIDFARVAAFRKQAELAVKSGVRSALSAYDPVFYARYGLFIRGGDSADDVFRNALEGNVSSRDAGAFAFLDTRWEAAEVLESRPLANHEVFRRQILEEMKYKAPIDLALELAGRFRGVSGAMKEAASTVKALEQMRKAYDRRESALDRVLTRQIRSGKETQRSLDGIVPYPAVPLTEDVATGTVRNVADMTNQYNDYVNKRLEDEAREVQENTTETGAEEQDENISDGRGNKGGNEIERETPQYGEVVGAYEAGVSALSAVMAGRANEIRSDSEDAYADAREALLAAKAANDEMKTLVNQAQSAGSAANGETNISSDGDEEILGSMAQIREMAEDIVLEDRFMDEYAAEIADQRRQIMLLAEDAARLSSASAALIGSVGQGQTLRGAVDRLQRSFADFIGEYGETGNVLKERESILQARRTHDAQRKEEERKANGAWTGVTHFLGTLAGISGSEEEQSAFKQLNGLYEANLAWNKEVSEQARTNQASDPFDNRDQSLERSGSLMDMLQGAVQGTRDQLYFSEYAYARLSSYDPVNVKQLLQNAKVSLMPHLQESEYILYGFNNPSANIAAAYGEILGMRLAIRTMEGLVECRAMGHPLLVLSASLVYGIRNALSDMRLLIENGSVQLSKYARIDTTYADYLRLFLLAHGGSSSVTARMIAAIEQSSGLSLQGAYTYAIGEGTGSVSLWFFPGLLKAMGKYGKLGGTVKGNRYEATYIAESAYQ